MPANLREFEESTAFERYVLDRTTPLLPTSEPTSVIELGDAGSTSISVTPQTATATVSVGATDSTGSAGDQLNIDLIRPLLFGAAWKVLDLLIELGLERASVPHDQKWKYSIKFKAGKAQDGCVWPVPPCDGWPHLWLRVLGTYASTQELRHSLVHRQLRIDQSTGAISKDPQQQSGRAPQALTRDEQSAICQVAVGVAEAAIDKELTTRRAGQLSWLLDQLTALHGQSSFSASLATGRIPVVIVRPSLGPSNDLTLDFAVIRDLARAAVGGVSHYDLKIHLPDERVLAGPLEDAPAAQDTFSVALLPDWPRWE